MILRNANVIDVIAREVSEGVDIVISGESIHEIGSDLNCARYPSAQVIDVEGQYVIPGLIEGHAHITQLPEQSLTIALRKGVVALRDMAGDGYYLRVLKAAVNRGEVIGPDIYFSALLGGQELIMKDTRVKLSTPPEYDLGEAPWARLVDSNSDISQIVLDAKDCGATGIKLYAYLSADVISRVTAEARRSDLKVWAHAVVYPATVEEVVAARVDAISHSSFLLLPEGWSYKDGSRALDISNYDSLGQRRLFQHMVENDVAFDPTLVVNDQMLSSMTDRSGREAMKEAMFRSVQTAYEMGVTIMAGTDMPLPRVENDTLALYRELVLLVTRAKMTPLDALRSATIINAQMLGIDDVIGSVNENKRADMIVLRANPLDDIHNIAKIRFVIKGGRIVN
ncbi:amidohydrolase family protein [bacterium]|nr:amidohydrolase family protein [bacterium]